MKSDACRSECALLKCAIFLDYRILNHRLPDSDYLSVRASVDQVRHAHYRLVWVTGESAGARSRFLNDYAEQYACPLIGIGRMLSAAILEHPAPLRPASAEGAFYDILHSTKSEVLCLDHLEILFDEALMLKAVDLVRNASRRFVLIASWPGTADAEWLSFAQSDHPTYFRIPLSELECPVHTLSSL
jgi:hypothetical protein